MIANLGTLRREQLACKTDLEADPFFADIPIIAADDGDLETIMEQQLQRITEKGGKIGSSVIIHQPTARVAFKDSTKIVGNSTFKPYFNPITIRITVAEDLLVNRDEASGTGKPALTIAEAVAAVLARPADATHPIPRYVDGPYPLAPYRENDEQPIDTSKIGYYIEVTTEGWATALATQPTNPGP